MTPEHAAAWLALEGWSYRDENQMGCAGVVKHSAKYSVLFCHAGEIPVVYYGSVSGQMLGRRPPLIPPEFMDHLPLAVEFIIKEKL